MEMAEDRCKGVLEARSPAKQFGTVQVFRRLQREREWYKDYKTQSIFKNLYYRNHPIW